MKGSTTLSDTGVEYTFEQEVWDWPWPRPCTGKWQSSAGKGSCVWTQQRWTEELVASLNQVGVAADCGKNAWEDSKRCQKLLELSLVQKVVSQASYKGSTSRLAAPPAHTVVYKPQAQRVSREPLSCCASCVHHGKEASPLELFAATGQCKDGRPISCSRAVKLQSAMVAWTMPRFRGVCTRRKRLLPQCRTG